MLFTPDLSAGFCFTIGDQVIFVTLPIIIDANITTIKSMYIVSGFCMHYKGVESMKFATHNRRRHIGKLLTCSSCYLGISLIAGCGEAAKPWEVVVPAMGQITFEGEPVEGAQITLVPASTEYPETVRPSATTAAGGNFVLGTYGSSDGAPAGEYKASIVWFKLVDEDNSGPVRGDNVLPAKYASPDSSGIRVVVNESEANVATIELSDN